MEANDVALLGFFCLRHYLPTALFDAGFIRTDLLEARPTERARKLRDQAAALVPGIERDADEAATPS